MTLRFCDGCNCRDSWQNQAEAAFLPFNMRVLLKSHHWTWHEEKQAKSVSKLGINHKHTQQADRDIQVTYLAGSQIQDGYAWYGDAGGIAGVIGYGCQPCTRLVFSRYAKAEASRDCLAVTNAGSFSFAVGIKCHGIFMAVCTACLGQHMSSNMMMS